jgi:hypothetical protein
MPKRIVVVTEATPGLASAIAAWTGVSQAFTGQNRTDANESDQSRLATGATP